MTNHRLIRVQGETEWNAYHAIREQVLFEARGRYGVYDRNHPDEHADGNNPFLLLLDARPIGAIRIDIRVPIAYFRRVAIREDVQRHGHGTVMMQLAEQFARDSGCTTALSNVASDAVAFYSRLGFAPDTARDALPSVAMIKPL